MGSLRRSAILAVLVTCGFIRSGSSHAADVHVKLTVAQMHCIKTSEGAGLLGTGIGNTDDEVYFRVSGQTSGGPVSTEVRPSPDNYWHYEKGQKDRWIDKDGKQTPPPTLWQGKVTDGQSAQLIVVVCDQDNAELRDLLAQVDQAFVDALKQRQSDFDKRSEKQKKEFDAWVDDSLARAFKGWELGRQVIRDVALRARHDILGAFLFTLTNKGGTVQHEWRPVLFTSIAAFDGKTVPPPPRAYELMVGKRVDEAKSEIMRLYDKPVAAPSIMAVCKGCGPSEYHLVVASQ